MPDSSERVRRVPIDRRLPAEFDTLGFHTADPWALPALRLLYANPRTYPELVSAWASRYPSTLPALRRLAEHGFARYQPGIIVNTVTGLPAPRRSRAVPRYRVTKKGRRLAEAAGEDPAVLLDTYAQMSAANAPRVADLLVMFNLRRPKNELGISVSSAVARSELTRPIVRWWVRRWLADGVLAVLPHKVPDTREVLPGHWRPTSAGASHLRRLFSSFDRWADFGVELGVGTFREIPDISALRVTDAGTTDYDHDLGAQQVFAAIVSSPTMLADAVWRSERVMRLPVNMSGRPWVFDPDGSGAVSYQPDGLYRERTADGRVAFVAYEYERSQTRLEAWGHIERFLGYAQLHIDTEAVLRFVVDNRNREATYVGLVDAFSDYLSRNPHRAPGVDVRVEVASRMRLLSAADALHPSAWHRVRWPAAAIGLPAVHAPEVSPAKDYF